MFGNGQYVIPAWTLCQWQIMPSAKIYYDWYYLPAIRLAGRGLFSRRRLGDAKNG